jgi:hypothetical protein
MEMLHAPRRERRCFCTTPRGTLGMTRIRLDIVSCGLRRINCMQHGHRCQQPSGEREDTFHGSLPKLIPHLGPVRENQQAVRSVAISSRVW